MVEGISQLDELTWDFIEPFATPAIAVAILDLAPAKHRGAPVTTDVRK